MPNQPWDGITERRHKATDHDTLIGLVQILNNHVENFNKLHKKFEEHILEDARRFDAINRTVWTATGAVGVVVFIINIAPRLWGH